MLIRITGLPENVVSIHQIKIVKMRFIRHIFLALAPLFFSVSSYAQGTQESSSASTPVWNPISDMLDSLVTITHVVRYNQLDANCFESNPTLCKSQGPVFSDEIYSKRIAAMQSPIPLSYNKHVREFIELYANRKRGLTQRVIGLSNLYFPLFEETLDREGLPLEFKYLAIVESALNPVAVSRVGATGLWQFMYNTGLLYNLKVNSYTDDRRDPIKSTAAACQYFKDMYRIYGDWLLVIASYNCGPGNVNRAIKRSGGKTNFWEIMPYLPAETRGYVPAFIAVAYVMNHAREHQLTPVAPAFSYFEVDTVTVNQPVQFSVLARSLDLPLDVIQYLNPTYKRGLIPDVGSDYVLRLPTNKMAQYINKQSDIFTASALPPRPVMPRYDNTEIAEADTGTAGDGSVTYQTITKKVKKTYTVRRGDNLAKIADKHDMTLAELKKMNKLRSNSISTGKRLTVYAWVTTKVPVKNPAPVPAAGDKDSAVAGNAKIDSTTDTQPVITGENVQDKSDTASESLSGKYVYHIVQPGDTLWNIARRYEGTTVELIKDINNLQDGNLKPGTRLKVKVDS